MQARARRPGKLLRPVVVVACLALMLALAVFMLGSSLNPETLRADLAEAVRRQTGRELTTGAVHLSLGLAPQIVLDDVALANPPGFSRTYMVTAQHVRARVALLPLLGGDAVISALTVENPDLLLERAADGTPNWQFAQPDHRALYTGHGAGGGGGGARHVEIRSLALEGGQASWRPATAAAPLTVAIDRLVVSSNDVDGPLDLAFTGSTHEMPIKIHATSGSLQRLQGGAVSAVAGAWPLSVDASVRDATLHIAGGFAHPEQGRGYQLRARLDAPSLGQLAGLWPGFTLPPLSQVTGTALLEDGSQGDVRASQVAVHAGVSDLSAWAAGLTVKQAALTAPGPGQIAQLSVDGTYQDQPLRASATAMQPDIVGASGPIQISVDAQAAGAILSAHGTVPPRVSAAGLDLQISAHAPDLSALSPLAGRALPPAHDAAFAAELGDAGVRLRGIVMRNLTVTSSLGDLSGELTGVWSPRPDIEGTLTSHMLDLDGLVPGATLDVPAIWPPPDAAASAGVAQSMPSSASPQPSSAPPAAAAPLPLAWLRGFDTNLSLSIGDLAWGGRHYTDAQARLLLQDGKLALNPFRAQTPDGPLTGGVSIDASSDQPPVAITLRSAALSAGAVAAALGYPGGASGTLQIDALLSGTGQTAPALEATLGGHLGVAMVGGQVDENLVQGLLGDVLNTAGVQSFGGGAAQVRCFALRLDFNQGVGNVRALAADTSRLTLDGDGQIDLSGRTADLHLRPRVRLGPTEIAAPVSLRGPFGQMRAALDPVVGGGRYGLTIGSAPAGPSACAGRLALARGGLGGPMPTAADAPPDAGLVIRKPKDLLQGLFH